MYPGERFNSITHLIGAVFALAGLSILVVIASLQGNPWKIVSFSLYGVALVVLYTFSTLYHSISGAAKPTLRKLDHIAIYLLIAGTYMPFVLVTLRGPWGWTLFGLVWALAAVGIVLDARAVKSKRVLQIAIYIVMGWLIFIAFRPMLNRFPTGGLLWLAGGGLFYTVGVAFYALSNRIRHFHGIWHLFVLAGSVCHYLAILLYVA